MPGGNALLTVLFGKNHEQVRANFRQRGQRRARRRAAKTAPPMAGQAGPRPGPGGLRPPPPPGGPNPGAVRHPWEQSGPGSGPASGMPAQPPQPPSGGVAARQGPGEPLPGAIGEDAATTQRIPVAAVPDASGVTPPEPTGPEPGERAGETAEVPWAPASALPPEPVWVRVRRVLVLGLVVVLLAVGVVNIATTVRGWLASEPAAAPAPAVADVALAGFAEIVAVEYATWNEQAKQARQAALARFAADGVDIDGWNGTGMRRALSASAVDITRGGQHRAVVTVRVRTTTGTAPAPGQPAAAPSTRPGWVAVAIPVASRGGRLRVSATPALVGSAPQRVSAPVVTGAGAGDADFAESTRDTVAQLLRSYASGDLSYARAAGTTFAGLGGTVRLAELVQWQVAPLGDGADPNRRVGDATVSWQLPSGARLRCSYVITLQRDQGRWYLAAITPQSKDGQQ